MIDKFIKSYFSFYKDDTPEKFIEESQCISSLYDLISNLTKRIEQLENENVELTNELYELQNTIDTLKWQQNMLESKFN